METFLYFFVHFGLTVILPVIVLFRKPVSKLGLWTGTTVSVAVMIFLYLWGQWPLVGSYYGRFLPVVMAVVVIVFAVRGSKSSLPLWPPRIIGKAFVFIFGALACLVLYMVISAIIGQRYPEPSVDLEFPLKGGDYYISSGGSSKIINNHMRDFPNAQEFAIDINKLGSAGGASSNILSSANENHHIFSMPVYAPCTGTIKEAVNDVADNAGASMNVDASDGSGNYLSLDCEKAVVSLLHLRFGSLLVKIGDRVEAGQVVGKVGNSGFSQQPHLHLHAAVQDDAGNLIGIPMKFGGRALSRNDIFTAAD